MHKSVTILTINADEAGQRLDNWLFARCRGVPKSRIYRAIRSGEVRINGKRVRQTTRVALGDTCRIPPLAVSCTQDSQSGVSRQQIQNCLARILFEDKHVLVIDKPAGMSTQGGTGIRTALIDIIRASKPELAHCYLVHRLDKATSGCLVIAKSRAVCAYLQQQWNTEQVQKVYSMVVLGRWQGGERLVSAALRRMPSATGNAAKVCVDTEGKAASTVFSPIACYENASVLSAVLKTGRMHQIRVHAAHIGHPLWGDDKYGDFKLNRRLAKAGLTRLCLHAWKIQFPDFAGSREIAVQAPLSPDWQVIAQKMDV